MCVFDLEELPLDKYEFFFLFSINRCLYFDYVQLSWINCINEKTKEEKKRKILSS